MKRILTALFTAAFLLCSVSAFAQTPLEAYNEAWSTMYTSGSAKLKLTTTLDTPLPAALDPDGSISDILGKLNMDYDIAFQVEPGQPVVKEYAALSIDQLTQEIPAIKMQMWIDMNLTDDTKPVYQVIMKYTEPQEVVDQIGDKYMVMDYTQMPGMLDSLKAMKAAGLLDANKTLELQRQILTQLQTNLEPAYKDGVYTLTLGEKALKEAFQSYGTVMAESFSALLQGSGSSLLYGRAPADEQTKEMIAKFFEDISGVSLFDAENAFTLETTLDEQQQLKTVKYAINVDTDIAEVAQAFGQAASLPEGTEAGQSPLRGTIAMDMTYDGLNKPVELNFPTLTAENSIDMLEMLSAQQNPYGEGVTVLYNGTPILYSDAAPMMDVDSGLPLIPLRDTLNALGIENENINYDNGSIVITVPEGSVRFAIGDSTAYADDEALDLTVAPQLIGDRTYVSSEYFEELFGLGGIHEQYFPENDSYIISIID